MPKAAASRDPPSFGVRPRVVAMRQIRALQRSLSHRPLFTSRLSFLNHLYDHLLLRRPALPMPFRGKTYSLRLRAFPHPLVARYGSSDFDIASEVLIFGEYAEAARHITGLAPRILDLGANAGYSLLFWCQRFPECRVPAVEPDASNLATARRNVELAGASARIRLIQAAAVGRERRVFLDRSTAQCAFRVSDDQAVGKAVDGARVETLLNTAGFTGRVDLLKCDIEGAEAELFSNGAGWIRRFRLIVVETHLPYTIAKLTSDLEANGAAIEPLRLEQKGDELGIAVIAVRE